MTLASGGGGSPIFPLVVHQPAFPDCLAVVVCYLLTPITLASGGSPIFPPAVHQPASLSDGVCL